MKKTMTINLNGTVFHIDEDAYQLLNQYLEDLGRHFVAEERDEILRDIEARIAELFTEKLVNRTVVEIADVQDVMNTMGQPNQFEDENTESQTKTNFNGNTPKNGRRKLYRDIENKRIGGVAAGVAAYMDWDVMLVRILFVLILLLSVGWTVFIYILMWIFVPEASSVAQRLEMQGVDPTVDNIRDFDDRHEVQPSAASSRFGKVIKVLAVVVLSCIALGLFAAVIGVLIAFFMFLFNVFPAYTNPLTFTDAVLLCSVALFMLCPAIAIVMFCSYVISDKRPRHKATAWVLLGIWIASFIGMAVFGCVTLNKRSESAFFATATKAIDSVDDDETADFLAQTRDCEGDVYGIDAEGPFKIIYTQGDSLSVKVKAPDNKQESITTRVRDGILYIRNENHKSVTINNKTFVVEVTAPALKVVKLSEACSLKSNSPMQGGTLEMELEEAAQISLIGNVDTLNVKAEEASNVDLENLNANVATIKANEASTVSIGKANKLIIRSEEASKVTYKGEPQFLQSSSSSSFVSHFSD